MKRRVEKHSSEQLHVTPPAQSYTHTRPTNSIGAQSSSALPNHSRLHDLSAGAQSQYFGSRPRGGDESPVNVKKTNSTKAHPPKHNNFFSQTIVRQPSKIQKEGRALRGDHHNSKLSQEKVSKQSSSLSSKQFGGCSMITSSDNLLSHQKPQKSLAQQTFYKSSLIKPTGIETTASKCHSMTFKKEMSSDSKQAYAFASQDHGSKAILKGQSLQSQATGDKNTCVGSSDQLGSSLNNKGKFRRAFIGESSATKGDAKIKSSSNLLESYGGNSGTSQKAPTVQSFAQVASTTSSKQLKAHRGGAPDGTTGLTIEDDPQLQSTFRMFQTDLSQGRAAQRYASVDKEDFDSHISLSSCVSEGGKPGSNRLSAKQKYQKDLSHKTTSKFQTCEQNGAQLPTSKESIKQGFSQTLQVQQVQVNNFLSQPAGSSAQKSSNFKQRRDSGRRAQPPISVDCEDDTSHPFDAQNSRRRTRNFQENLLGQQQNPSFNHHVITAVQITDDSQVATQNVSGMKKITPVGDLYSGTNLLNSKTATAQKESIGYLHTLSDKKSYNKTPNGPLEGKAHNQSSLSPNSRTTSSYRDSESLGFALSERQKAHQLKQLKLKQMLEQKQGGGPNTLFLHHHDGGTALNLGTSDQISLRMTMNKVNSHDTGPQLENPLLLHLPERALQMKHEQANSNKTEVQMAAARTLQRLQFEQQSSESPNYSKQHRPQSPEQHQQQNLPSYAYPNQHNGRGAMIEIQEQQDSEDNTQSLYNTQSQHILRSEKPQQDVSESPSKINAMRSKPQKKNIDKEVIKYFKRMVKNQQIDKFKAQMNSQSTLDLKEERNLSPRLQHRTRVNQKKIKLARSKPSKASEKSSNNPIIVNSHTLDSDIGQTVVHHSSSQSQDLITTTSNIEQQHFQLLQRTQPHETELETNFFQTQPNVWSNEINGEPLTNPQRDSSIGARKSVPRLPVERIAQLRQEEKVINIVTGGSFGRHSNHPMPNAAQSPNTQRPPNTITSQVVARNQLKSDQMSERREFHRTLKKAIVSLQQLQSSQKSTTGETPYNTHGRKQKSTRPERNQSFNSYNSTKVKSQDGHQLTKTQRNTQLPVQEKFDRANSPKVEQMSKKRPITIPKINNNPEQTAVSTRKQDSSNLVFTMQNVKESFGTPTANSRKMTNEDVRLLAQMEASADDYMHCSTRKHASSSYAGDSGEFNTFGRPSAQSQELRKESSFTIDSSPTKDYVEGLDMQTLEQASIRKLQKKRKVAKQLIPKPEPSKRLRKTLKTKKKLPEQGKVLSVGGSNTGPHSLTGSKRCSTSHFGVVGKSQQSSAAASKESSKRQSMVSSLSKRSAKQSNEAIQHINLEKGFKPQSSSGCFMATPILKKSMIKKAGGSGQHQESRKHLSLAAKETCSTQLELKKKLGMIYKQQQLLQGSSEQTFDSVSNHQIQGGSLKATMVTKKRRQSQADSTSVRRQQVINQAKMNAATGGDSIEPQSQRPQINVLSPKGFKKIGKSRDVSKKEGGQKSRLGQLYTQLNTLLVRKEDSSLLGSQKDRKVTAGYQQHLKRSAIKDSLYVGSTINNHHALLPSSSQQIINEKKSKLSGSSTLKMIENLGGNNLKSNSSAALQQSNPIVASPSPAHISTRPIGESQQTTVEAAKAKPSHSRKKSEAVLKKSGSSQQLISDRKLQQMTIQQPPQGTSGTAAALATTQSKQTKKTVNVSEQRGRKVDLMQPMSNFLTKTQGRPHNNSSKELKSSQGGTRAGKSRNVSDQCYQHDNHGSGVAQYSIVSPSKMLYKTSGNVVGSSRNAKQQFGTLAGLQLGSQHVQHQYQSHSHILRHNNSGGGANLQLLEATLMAGHQVMSSAGPQTEAAQNFTRDSIRKAGRSYDQHNQQSQQQQLKSSFKKSLR